MKKVYRFLTIFSLFILLIFELTFFHYDDIKSYVISNSKKHLSGDTDGITNTKLDSLVIDEYENYITFDSDTLIYNISIFSSTYRLDITATPIDSDASVTITGNKYMSSSSGTILITVSNGIEADTVYELRYSKNLTEGKETTSYACTSSIQSYSVTSKGYYKLEVWGAAGGTAKSAYRGGYGGYSVGVVYLDQGDVLYIGVGGAGLGTTPNGTIPGGYNGGGTVPSRSGTYIYQASGGGATHIALNVNRGLLSSYSANQGEVLIVAGGGGGGYKHSEPAGRYEGIGGDAGGYQGKNGQAIQTNNYYGIGGSQSSAGCSYNTNKLQCGGFGYGGNAGTGIHGSAGGAGWYGGGGCYAISGSSNGSGGGGSSYIGNSKLLSYGGVTKKMYAYSTSYTSTTASIYTVSTTAVSSVATANSTKIGDGAARITKMEPATNNDYLSNLTSNVGEWDKEFSPIVNDYKITVPTSTNSITLTATLSSSKAVKDGDGTFNLDVGYNYFTITVASEIGTLNVYNVTVLREPLRGKHSTKLYKIESAKNYETVFTSDDVYQYTLSLYSHQTNLGIKAYPYDQSATITIEGDDILAADSTVRIIVSYPGLQDSIYIISFNYYTAGTVNEAYSYSGSAKTFTAPADSYYTIELWGARGGAGGNGGYTRGKIFLNRGQKLYFYVGGVGGSNNTQTNVGGWNGGAYSGDNPYGKSFGGGGATDVRLKLASSTLTVWNEIQSLRSRIMVAGGGGGMFSNSNTGTAGVGGGLKGTDATGNYDNSTVTGGTQLSGGVCSTVANKGGSFGYGPQSNQGGWGGGGGGGYYAGAIGNGKPGSGGSSYISGLAGSVAVESISSSNPRRSKNNNRCTHEYALTDVTCSYHYSGMKFIDAVTIAGNATMPNFAGTGTMTGNSSNGYAKINAEFVSDNYYLRDLTSDIGEWDKEFSSKIFEYNITVDSYADFITLFGTKYLDAQEISGLGVKELDIGDNTFNIVVTAENGETKTYVVNVFRRSKTNTAELYKIILDEEIIVVDEGVTEFSYTMSGDVYSLSVQGIPFDSNSEVNYIGFGYIKSDKSCYITVRNENADPQEIVYTIYVEKESGVTTLDFGYTGTIQTFKAPGNGIYQLEVWGAQGGNSSNGYIGGYGAYSTGLVSLKQNDIVYIVVGGAGVGGLANKPYEGGYNGGGRVPNATSSSSNRYNASGGGATHIATRTGLLSSLSNYRSSVLIVAGGGGGGYYHTDTRGKYRGYGAAGGGYVGNTGEAQQTGRYYGIGGNQTSAGCSANSGTNCGGFGYGGSAGEQTHGSGGGAGWFGGGGSYALSGYANASGGGGSGYIGNSVLTSMGDYTKHMTCYNCSTSKAEATYTKSTTKYSATPTSDYAKSGNGAARITYVNFSSDNFLKTLKISDVSKDTSNRVFYNETSTDDEALDENIVLNLDSDVTKVKLESKPNDSKSTIAGNGEYLVKAGSNTYEIVVTAENSSTRTYTITINRDANTNIYPDSIEINGLVQSLCKQDDSYCVQTDMAGNTQAFNKDVNEYYMTVPSRIKQVKFNVIKGHYFQKVTGDGVQDLTKSTTGTTDITIDIMSEYCSINELTDESCYSHYTYHITRDTASDTDIKRMFIDNKNTTGEFTIDLSTDSELSFDFKYENPDVYDYYFSVPNEWTYIKYLYYEKDAEGQEISVIGNEEGDFSEAGRTYLVQVVVTAPNKVDTATYRLHVYRELNSNIYLSSLSVTKDETTYALNMDFVKSAFDYEVTIPYEISEVDVNFVTEVNTTNAVLTSNHGIISSNKTISNIPTGKTVITITTTSEKSVTGVYTITLTRIYNDDSKLSDLVVKTDETIWNLDPTPFDSDTYEYNVEVDEGVTSVDIIPTVSDTVTPATYKLLDNNKIVVGTNTKRILVTAEDGTYSTYIVNVIRPASADALLKTLTVVGSDSQTYGVTLEEDVFEYEIEVPNEVTSVTVTGVRNSLLATLSGNGKYFLQTGENSIQVIVQAENQLLQVYTITITRAYNSNARLSSISGGDITPTFNENDTENTSYTINVPYTTTKINLLYTPSASTTNVTAKDLSDNILNGKRSNNSYTLPMNLVTGNNKVKLITLAEDGTSSLTYNVNVVKAPSDDATLKTLRLKETRLVPTNVDKSYTAKLPYNIDPVHLIVEVNDPNSNYSVNVSGGLTYKESDNSISGTLNETSENKTYTITVTVTAEDASIEVYTIDLTMQAEGNASNYLMSLSINPGTLSPIFDKDILYYEASIGNNITSVNVSCTLDDPDASFSGCGTYNNLKVGENEINVVVTATDGYERVYQIIVTRAPSNDATLKALSIKEASLNPGFISSTYTYSTSVDGTYIDFASIVTNSEYATYEVINNEPGTLVNTGDTAEVIIRVTAEDKVTTKDYVITVTKLPSGNNNLASLTVVGYTISPTFNKNTVVYSTTVENDVSSVLVEATAEDSGATITGTGVISLSTGVNNVSVDVTSESGVTKSYLISITREYSNNAFIDYLNVNNGQMNQSFDKNTTNYDVVIDYEVTKLDLSVILEDNSASYRVEGNNITGNTGLVQVIVTAENGTTTKTYNLNVTKDITKNALLKSLSESNYRFKTNFNSYIFNYQMTVNYETTSLDLTAIPAVTGAKVEILNNTLEVGDNTVTVRVTALDNETTQDYVIKVTRNKEVNNYLDYLFNDYLNGDFNEDFSKTRLNYTLTVESDIDSIILYGEKQSRESTLDIVADAREVDESLVSDSYLGTFGLTKGSNEIKINVTNQGFTRTYIVTITRKLDSEKELLSLVVKGNNSKLTLTPEFTVGRTEPYTLTVDKDMNMIELDGTVSPLATVTGFGDVYLNPGLNTILITVTAEDGTTKVVTLEVTKEASTETHLIDLIPSSGSLNPAFGYETTVYNLELDSSVLTLSFDATLEDGNATITGLDSQVVPEGTSTRTIVVTAEDKTTTRTYTINVSKIISDDADLLNVKVKDYDFINKDDEITKVTFNKDTLEYYVIVNNDKTKFDKNDLTVTKSDSKSKINYSEEISLSTKTYTEYDLIVTAEDGITKKTYKINVKRKMGSSSEIISVKPTMGYLETLFEEEEYNYVWRIPVGREVDINRLGITLKDPNATYVSVVENHVLSITVTSEDGSSVSTYIFEGEFDYNTNVLIGSLKVFDSNHEFPYTPEVNDEDFEYTARVYENQEKVKIQITPQAEEGSVKYNGEEVTIQEVDLPDAINTFEFSIIGEDGVTEQIYTIIIKKDILIEKTMSLLEIIDENEVCTSKTCIITPTFDPNTSVYKTSVPYEYNILNLDIGLNEEQSYKLFIYEGENLTEITNGEYELGIGTNNIYIFIYDLLGDQTKNYRLTFTRNKSTNTNLNALSISKDGTTYEFEDKDGNPIEFSNSVNEYYITVPYSVEDVEVNYIQAESGQKVKTSGYNYFTEGDTNDISVKVTAPDGRTSKTIIIHAYRESQYEVFLEDIVVSSGYIWSLSPDFDKRKTSYVVTVTNGTEYAKVEGFGEADVQVSDAETRQILTGVNEFEVTASKVIDGEVHTKTYTVTVIRPVASEVYLSDLKVSSTIDGEYLTFKNEIGDDITFDRGTTDYYLEVSPGIKNLNIKATPGQVVWNVAIYGNNFATGRNIVSIIVYNEEYTTSRTYQLVVTVKPSQDASITAVTVKDDEETYGVSAEDFALVDDRNYTVNVPYDVDKVDVSVTPTIDVATVQGNGTYYLEYGNNVVTIDVIAEDGETTETYTVNIFRAYNLYLSAINEDCEEADIKEEFLKTKNDYTMEVSNDVTSFSIEGVPEESNVTVTYSLDTDTAVGGEIINGKLYTGVGINKVLITVTAPDNTTNVYKLNVTRKQSDNNYLSALDFNEGNLNETFIKTDNNYTMYVLDTYTSLSYDNKKDILTEDPTASYVVSGLSPLSKTQDNTVTITVTSQSGKTNIYTVTVMLKPEAWFKHYLQKLELTYKTKGQNNEDITNYAVLSPQFNMEKMAYTSTVPYGVASITVNTQTVVPDDEALIRASTETGSSIANGTFALNLGRNVINVKVYSTLANNDGSYAIYKVIVYRQSNPDAYLSNLAIANHVLSPGFSSTVFNYAINIDTSEIELDIEAIPRDPNATVTITGNGPFHEGTNTITIHVLAADGSTYLDYHVTANCQLSDNNYLASLVVKDYEIDPGFIKTNTGVYLVNVDNDVTSVYITAIKEDLSASMTLQNGSTTYTKESTSIKLNPGNNYIYIAVSSARGNTRTYTLNVFRSYSTDNTLRDLIISDGTLKPSFDPETKEYDVILEDNLYYLSTVSVIGLKNHSKATVRGNGEYTLNESGTKTVTIEVTAESGDKREYKVNFIKKEAPSSQLLFLEVYEGELIPEFNKDGYKYYVTVPNEVTSLDLEVNKNVVAVDEDAEITISNNSSFKVGINVVTIKVTASNNDVKNYYLYVTRSILASNYLSDLYVDDYEINPSFDPDTLYYELIVGSNVESVNVHGEKDDPTSTLEINGSEVNDKVINLAYGENKVYFTVTSENGATRTYTLVVTRSDSDEYYLLTLETNIGTWDKDFDKDYNGVYTISVPEKTSMIVFTGTTSVGSTVEGLDSVQVKLGDNNHKIVVTSPSGLKNTYNFKIVRPGSNNTDILSITSNHGDLTLEDNVYKLSVDDSDSNISFIVNLSDPDAKVIMNSSYNLTYGKNEITITIQAEDGTEKEVAIEIYRYRDIESISYDEDEIILNINEKNTPIYTINPENTDYKEVTFRSDDESIAIVDSNGEITAVGPGITYVYVVSSHNERIFDWIRVNVASTKITSQVYNIWRVGESENNLASVDFSYVIGANDKTRIDDFETHFDNDPNYLKVYSKGELVPNVTDYVGTGMILKLEINGVVFDELTIIVRGDNGTVDKPGNGIITSTDYATLSSILAGLTVKTPIISLLYDLNKNKILTVTDLSPMSLYIAGKATFTNLNGLN